MILDCYQRINEPFRLHCMQSAVIHTLMVVRNMEFFKYIAFKSSLFSLIVIFIEKMFVNVTVIILNIGTDKSEQTVQTQIRLLLMEQSDQGLLCLLFCLHLLNTILHCKIQLFQL